MWTDIAPRPQPLTASSIPRDEWDLMFAAVVIRLRRTATSPAPTPQVLQECIEALEQLHVALGRHGVHANGDSQDTHEARERRDIREMWRARSGTP